MPEHVITNGKISNFSKSILLEKNESWFSWIYWRHINKNSHNIEVQRDFKYGMARSKLWLYAILNPLCVAFMCISFCFCDVCSSICWAPHAQSSSANTRNFTRTNVRIWRRVWNNSLNAYFARTINSPLQLNNWPIGQFHVITTCAVVQERCERSNSSKQHALNYCVYVFIPKKFVMNTHAIRHFKDPNIHPCKSVMHFFFVCRPHNAQLQILTAQHAAFVWLRARWLAHQLAATARPRECGAWFHIKLDTRKLSSVIRHIASHRRPMLRFMYMYVCVRCGWVFVWCCSFSGLFRKGHVHLVWIVWTDVGWRYTIE